jgi:ankyrin repeat protein
VGTTPLISASFNGHECIVQVLLDMGADLTAATKVGNVEMKYSDDDCHIEHHKLLLNVTILEYDYFL